MNNKRVIENSHEFVRASQYSLHFRRSLAKYTNRLNYLILNAILIKTFVAIIKSDKTNIRGERILQPENITQMKNLVLTKASAPQLYILQNFEVNIEGTSDLKAVFKFSGEIIPNVHFKKIEGATHIELSVVLLQTKFNDSDKPVVVEKVQYYKLDDSSAQSQTFETPTIPPSPGIACLALLFVSYYQEVNGVKYLMSEKRTTSSVIADIKAA